MPSSPGASSTRRTNEAANSCTTCRSVRSPPPSNSTRPPSSPPDPRPPPRAMSEVPGSRGFAHRPRVHSAGDERGPWISGFRSSLGGFQSEAGRAFVAEGGDALAVLGGAHRLVEEADRIAHRRRRVVAEEILGELTLGDGDGVR